MRYPDEMRAVARDVAGVLAEESGYLPECAKLRAATVRWADPAADLHQLADLAEGAPAGATAVASAGALEVTRTTGPSEGSGLGAAALRNARTATASTAQPTASRTNANRLGRMPPTLAATGEGKMRAR